MEELTKEEKLILAYLKRSKAYVGPTQIGRLVFNRDYSVASSRVSRVCRKLVEKGLLVRHKGKYAYVYNRN